MKFHFAPNDVYPFGTTYQTWNNDRCWKMINTIHPKFFQKMKELLKPHTPDACNQ